MRSFWLYTLKWTFGGLFLIFITFKASTGNFLLELLGSWTIASMGVLCWDGPKRLYSEKICGRNVIMRFCLQKHPSYHTASNCFPKKNFIFEIRKLTTRSFFSFSISWLCNLIFPNKCPGLCRHFTNHKFLISEE